MTAMQRRKGARGERELAGLLGELLGADVTRNLVQARAIRRCGELLKQIESGQGKSNQYTVLQEGALPKQTRTEAAKDAGLSEWWLQTCQQATATGQRPALFYRLDRRPWRVVVALRDVATGFDHAPLVLRLEADLEVFAALVRESLP